MKLIRKISLVTIALGLLTIFAATRVKANEFLELKATAYCYNSGATATGTEPIEGRTLAGKREWFGKTVVMWENKGNGIEPQNYIGTFVCEDTGGETIRKGYVVDVFITDHDRAIEFGCKKVIIQLIDAEG